ncbi:MAG: pip, partial [Hyphomicrobiales bacterium]|nr:pip [Hyphomicrobiales bacterium]
IEPYASGHLNVGDNHRIYWEASGNPDGAPALFLHGGPGGGCHPDHRRLFDPKTYKIVLFDQRGCGRSLPHAELHANTTPHLVADIERLRELLRVENWLVLGGSWGAALALAYAQAHAQRVRGLILRGAFTARQCEVDWLYKHGASALFPESWEAFHTHVPEGERGDLVAAYHRRLIGADIGARAQAARAWCAWESDLLTLRPRWRRTGPASQSEIALARIEAHYFVHGSFMQEGELLANAPLLADKPAVIVQGRYDVVTPARTAYALKQAWPKADLRIVPDAGHATSEPGVLAALIMATDEMRGL